MLALNFHKTFVPERRYLGDLLRYAALGKCGDLQSIGHDTGIPMGESSGKVPAILDYAVGMGLVTLGPTTNSALKRPVLTAFGQAVSAEDAYLGLELTQWIAHINLCRSDIGAPTWHKVYAQGRTILGLTTTKGQIESLLTQAFGAGRSRTGPLLRMYQNEAAFGRAAVVDIDGEAVTRQKAPLDWAFAGAYAAIVVELASAVIPDHNQIPLPEFRDATLLMDICAWGKQDLNRLCALLDQTGAVRVDRQRQPWILEIHSRADELWPHIYNDIP